LERSDGVREDRVTVCGRGGLTVAVREAKFVCDARRLGEGVAAVRAEDDEMEPEPRDGVVLKDDVRRRVGLGDVDGREDPL